MTQKEHSLPDFLSTLENEGIALKRGSPLPPAEILAVPAADWGRCALAAKARGLRWSTGWGEDLTECLRINALLELNGRYLLLRTEVPAEKPELPSQAPHYPAADRSERHSRDLLGVRFTDHPDARRWTRHQAWAEHVHPLRKDYPASGDRLADPDSGRQETPPDKDYPFIQAKGAGVYEIPVGPIHAGIIEPGHFRFQAVGETVLNLEERFGYVHKGIEKIAESRDAAGLVKLAGRVSGDTTVGHAFAAAMACERASGIEIPPRAAFLRAILAERERIGNHLGDLGAICNDVGFAFAHYQFGRLRENWLRDNRAVFGHRLLMDRIVPGGVNIDLDPAQVQPFDAALTQLGRELDELLTIVDRNASLGDRLYTTGVLSAAVAADLGCLGYVGRASGQDFDVRRNAAYPPYDQLTVKVPVEESGDVGSRFWVRYKEIRIAMRLLRVLQGRLPDGATRTKWRPPEAGAEGLGIVEGWRGETVAYVRFGEGGLIDRYFPRDPSWLNWPALEQLILDNIVPDFPVCNKSINGSYSGADL
ncbi:hydrogenase large subunit [Methylohalobius crimeensis]|uniref:hydrogenase large subunit n=1 Tax=Methylohalobius crimeensis TaxID=244365 RepID=UPI0003B5584D|nr:NADH-quinone oxidoreductase subunit C [Methylohalobius crimeensis]